MRRPVIVVMLALFLSFGFIAGRPPAPRYGIADQVTRVRSAVVHIQKGDECQGSGCLLTSDGILFTARHITDGDPCGIYTVTLDDGSRYVAKYILEDREADVSYMKLDLPPGITTPYARLAHEDTMCVGDALMIFGSPLGKDNVNTVSLGILSAVNRNLDQREGWEQYTRYQWHAMIQSTSPAFPGVSGGPVFDMQGRVIGVLVAGQAETLNFAVPVARFRESIGTVRDWFALCRLRPLVPDMRGPQGPPGERGPQGPQGNPNEGENK